MIRVIGSCKFLLFFFFTACQAQLTDKPNVLFFLVDDLGYHDLSCHGSKIYQTPNIDQLANSSISFTNAYANYPRCVPSRYALMTGCFPINKGAVPDDGSRIGKIPPEQNFIQQFTQEGYQTAFFGKWHLGDGESSPEAMSYQVAVAASKAGSPISYLFPFNTPKGHNRKVKKAPIQDLEEQSKNGDYLTDVLTDQTIGFIENASKEKPFLAVLSFYAVHQPLEAKTADIETNRKEISAFDYGDQPAYISEGTGRTKMRQDHPTYAAMVENMDWNVGRVLQLLKEKGILDNTIIVFSSDHGGLSNDGFHKRNLATSNFPLRAGKGWMYEGGIRVPLFIKYDKIFQARKDTQSIVMLMDVFPTLLDLTIVEQIPEVDGKSFLPVLTNEENWSGRTIYWHASSARPRNTGEGKSSAIRSGDWKLVHFYEEEKVELYNLKSDPGEQTNLALIHPVIANELLLKLKEWKASH